MLFFSFLLAAALAIVTATAVDRGGERRGLLPPGFAVLQRRLAATALLSAVLLLGVFLPLTTSGLLPAPDVTSLGWAEIFGLQIVLLVTLALWYALGYLNVRTPLWNTRVLRPSDEPAILPSSEKAAPAVERPHPLRRIVLRRLGLASRHIGREIGIGVVFGFLAWMIVLLVSAALAGLLDSLGAGEVLGLGEEPSPLIVWLAAQPVLVRCAISLAAGISEELFFRGFLQPRVGIGLSTALFVAGHVGYGQPLMLAGITVLSLLYARLFRWRGNVWAAMTAHALFDAIQLLVIIPAALRAIEGGAIG